MTTFCYTKNYKISGNIKIYSQQGFFRGTIHNIVILYINNKLFIKALLNNDYSGRQYLNLFLWSTYYFELLIKKLYASQASLCPLSQDFLYHSKAIFVSCLIPPCPV